MIVTRIYQHFEHGYGLFSFVGGLLAVYDLMCGALCVLPIALPNMSAGLCAIRLLRVIMPPCKLCVLQRSVILRVILLSGLHLCCCSNMCFAIRWSFMLAAAIYMFDG